MKFGEIFADEETKQAACRFALEFLKDDDIHDEFYDDKLKDIRDAFIAGVVWKQMKDNGKL